MNYACVNLITTSHFTQSNLIVYPMYAVYVYH